MISIIVPIYKAEKYIHRCIDSILAQSHTDFELLLIDDGSPDNCGAICDAYAAQDSRIRIFHKENGGVSAARNLGIEKSKGEWLTFIDADDYVHPDFLLSLVAQHDADLIVGSFQLVGTDETWESVLNECYYDGDSFVEKVIGFSLTIHYHTPWAKLFRRDIIVDNHLRFDEKMHSSEDWLFVLNYLIHTKSLRTSALPYYYYERGNVDGLSQNSRYFDEYFYAMEAFYNVTNAMAQVYGDGAKSIYVKSIRGYSARQCHYLYNSKESAISKLKKLRQMRQDKHLMRLFKDSTFPWRKKIKLFHVLMSKGFLFTAFIYIHIMKGKVYW